MYIKGVDKLSRRVHEMQKHEEYSGWRTGIKSALINGMQDIQYVTV